MTLESIKALVFDVFGTVVDWRGSIIKEGKTFNQAKGLSVAWGEFADAWRGMYQPSMRKVRKGEIGWTILDELHRQSLAELLPRYGLTALSEAEQDELNRVWHRLDPWADAVFGLTRLRTKYTIAPLSNGNFALLLNMAKRAGLPWDCILSAELVKAYKPDPPAYQQAPDLLGLAPSEILMVAAHQDDLKAAQKVGLKTAFVLRPYEYGSPDKKDLTPDPSFDLVADDFEHLAIQLGV